MSSGGASSFYGAGWIWNSAIKIPKEQVLEEIQITWWWSIYPMAFTRWILIWPVALLIQYNCKRTRHPSFAFEPRWVPNNPCHSTNAPQGEQEKQQSPTQNMHHRPAHTQIPNQHHKHKEQKLAGQKHIRNPLHESLQFIDDRR